MRSGQSHCIRTQHTQPAKLPCVPTVPAISCWEHAGSAADRRPARPQFRSNSETKENQLQIASVRLPGHTLLGTGRDHGTRAPTPCHRVKHGSSSSRRRASRFHPVLSFDIDVEQIRRLLLGRDRM